MRLLYANGKKEIILIEFKKFCKKWDITIKYVVPYIYKKKD